MICAKRVRIRFNIAVDYNIKLCVQPQRPDLTANWRNSVYFHVIESNLYQWQKRSLPPAEQATSEKMNYFFCRHGVPHERTRIHTDTCSDGSRWRHINPSKVTVRQIHSTKEKPETGRNEQRNTQDPPVCHRREHLFGTALLFVLERRDEMRAAEEDGAVLESHPTLVFIFSSGGR